MRYSMELGFRVGISVILVSVTWWNNRYVAAFLGLALFGQFFPVLANASARAYHNITMGILLYLIIVNYGKDWTVQLLNMMCIVATVNVALAMLQTCGIHIMWQNAGGTVTGFMENQNSLSASLALCFPAFLRGRRKWLIPLVVLGLFLAKSSGGLIAVALGFSFFLAATVKDKRYLVPYGMGVIVAVWLFAIFFDQYQSLSIRIEAWSKVLILFSNNWVVGCGLGGWGTVFIHLATKGLFPEGFIRLHSTILQTMMEMGIGFIIILLGYFINIVRRSWGNLITVAIPLTALIIITANGSVNFLIRVAPNAALVIVWMAIMEIELRKTNGRNNINLH